MAVKQVGAAAAAAADAVTKGDLDAKGLGMNAQTGTTYTLVLADAEKWVSMTNASASTLTVPPNSSVAFPIGTEIPISQMGAGQLTIAAGAGVTIRSSGSMLKLLNQYSVAGLKKTATDTWLAYGRLVA